MSVAHVEMHQDHVRWAEEDRLFRDEIEIWQRDFDSIFRANLDLEEGLLNYKRLLKDHLAKLNAEDEGNRQHEQVLAGFERGESGQEERLIELAKSHEAYQADRKELVRRHDQLKTQHHLVMTHWALLLKALENAK